MALNYCTGCTTAYALSLDACPHCRQPTTTAVTELRTGGVPLIGVPLIGEQPPRRTKRRPAAEPEPEAGDDRS